jgi:hypothetical protein
VARIVDAVARQEIENPAPIVGKQIRSHAARILNIELQNIQQAYPLRIHAILVSSFRSGGGSHCIANALQDAFRHSWVSSFIPL